MRSILFFLCFYLFALTTQAQNKAYDSLDNSLLWKISGKNISAPIYLYGTIHSICLESVYWPETIDSILKNSNVLYLEIDVTKAESRYYDKSLYSFYNNERPKIQYTDNKLVNPNLKNAQLLNTVKKINAQPANSDSQDSVSTETGMYTYMDLECKEFISFEKLIYSKAKGLNMELHGFESFMKQYWVLGRVGVLASKSSGGNETPLSYLIDLYNQQQLNKIHKTIYESQKVPEINEILFDNRNKKWVKKLKSIPKNKSTFIAVGTGHLSGANGVIHLLRKEGYTVTAVSY